MTYQDISPLLLNELSGWKKNGKPLKLGDILKDNYLQYDGTDEEPSQVLDIAGKIPPAVLQEDEKLLMYFDNAQSMSGDDDLDW